MTCAAVGASWGRQAIAPLTRSPRSRVEPANHGRPLCIGSIYPIYELTDSDLAQVDLRDGSVAEWEELLPGPSIVAAQFCADPTVGDGAQYDPADLDFRVWLAWNGAAGRLYLAIERVDDVYINDYTGAGPGAVPGGMWAQDSVELLVDGDHSGGDFSASADPNWTPDEQKLNAYRTAQAYLAVATAPGNHPVGYMGAGGAWVDWPPFTDAGGGHSGGSPDTSVTPKRIPMTGVKPCGSSTMPRTNEEIITTLRPPPGWSTGSLTSPPFLGRTMNPTTKTTMATGTVIRKTEPHQREASIQPPRIGPSTEVPVPMPVHSEMARVLGGPLHIEAMSESVVG